MLLTLFYMISTWIQAWKLSSLKTRLATVLNYTPKPSIMFFIKPPDHEKSDLSFGNKFSSNNGICENLLSSHLCSNKNFAKLNDLLWCQGEKRLCTIYPQQNVDVSDWLMHPHGKTYFPLYVDNCSQANLVDDTKIHILIEADMENFYPNAFVETTKLEDFGTVVSWTADKLFAAILETDLDHLSKFSVALMQGQCFINNGLLLTRIESVEVTGKPCNYTPENSSVLQNKKLVGKTQWDEHMKILKIFGSTAKQVSQMCQPIEVDDLPGIIISPGTALLTLQMPTILEMNLQNDNLDDDRGNMNLSPQPSTPPPTPAAFSITDNLLSALSQASILSTEFQGPTLNPIQNSSESIATSDASEHPTTTNRAANYSPAKKPIIIDYSNMKPLNVLYYADSAVTAENIERVLKLTLNRDKYTIYKLSSDDARRDVWLHQTALVVVCGNVGNEIASQLVDYITNGGKLLALCSDALHILLPSFKTAEVREHELVRFSYGKWKNVQMMHHIFCYQASPVKTRFSQEDKSTTPPTPVSATVKDKSGQSHTFHIKVLVKEETWQTPSIVLADLTGGNGKAVFSQIHLEADPSQYEFEEKKYRALTESNSARLEILSDLLASHFAMDVKTKSEDIVFHPGHFLGRHELKLEMLQNLKDKMKSNDIFETSKIKLQFCGASTELIAASDSLLPIWIHQCPDNFSTIEYFENLSTKDLGRLVIYADVMTSSMNVVAGCQLYHGLAVIPYQQTQGQGRGQNAWLSPKGCAMFTLQLHIPLNSYIGRHLSILQHLVAAAIVYAIKTIPGYEEIDLRVKWPNDIYISDKIKIGGMITTSLVESEKAICNIGVGTNLSNSTPTTCINDAIKKYNEKKGTKLEPIGYERFFALVFNALENLLNIVQDGNINHFYQIYYDYWMHTNARVTVDVRGGVSQEVTILGIDKFGFLEVQSDDGKTFTVQPDGNSFDLLKGLIAPTLSR